MCSLYKAYVFSHTSLANTVEEDRSQCCVSTMHREGADIATSPNTSRVCMRLGLQTVVAEVEKLQSAFLHAIDCEDTRVLDQVGTCTYQKL